MHGIVDLIANPWLYVLVGVFILLRNLFGAFPAPDDSIKSGFGSCSPGYKLIYQFARGMTGDLNAIGVNLKGAVASKLSVKPEEPK